MLVAGRNYRDACGIARALDVVGERWTLLVVRELLLGAKRYTDLQADLATIAPDVLAQRLRDLVAAGLVRRTTAPGPGRARVYELTERGHQLEPVLRELGRFGSSIAMPEGHLSFSPDAAAVALRTTFDPHKAGTFRTTVQLRLGDADYIVTVADRELDVRRGTIDEPDATLDTTPAVLAAMAWHGRPLADAMRTADATTDGSAKVLQRLIGLFSQPA